MKEITTEQKLRADVAFIVSIFEADGFPGKFRQFERLIKSKLEEYNNITKRNVRIQEDVSGHKVLTWISESNKTIACPITEKGFMFTQAGVFTSSGLIESLYVHFTYRSDKLAMIRDEIAENKTLLKLMQLPVRFIR